MKFWAASRRQLEALRALRDLGCPMADRDKKGGTPRFVAAKLGRVEALPTLADLAEKGKERKKKEKEKEKEKEKAKAKAKAKEKARVKVKERAKARVKVKERAKARVKVKERAKVREKAKAKERERARRCRRSRAAFYLRRIHRRPAPRPSCLQARRNRAAG